MLPPPGDCIGYGYGGYMYGWGAIAQAWNKEDDDLEECFAVSTDSDEWNTTTENNIKYVVSSMKY